MLPRVATVRRAVDAVLLVLLLLLRLRPKPTAATQIGFDEREHHVAIPAIDIEPDAPLDSLRQAVGEFLPGVSAVGRAIDPAAVTAAVEAKSRATSLVHRDKQGLWIAWVHHQVDGPGIFIHIMDLLPALPAVGGAKDAAVFVGTPQMSHRGHVHHIVVRRIDTDAGDVLGVVQTHVLPCAPRVRRFVDAIAPGRALPVLRFTGPDPDEIRVRL